VWKHERNITDDQIDACAATEGVIGRKWHRYILALTTPLRSTVEHIDYIVQRVGPTHVGIGLDWVYDMESLMVLVNRCRKPIPTGLTIAKIAVAQPNNLPRLLKGYCAWLRGRKTSAISWDLIGSASPERSGSNGSRCGA